MRPRHGAFNRRQEPRICIRGGRRFFAAVAPTNHTELSRMAILSQKLQAAAAALACAAVKGKRIQSFEFLDSTDMFVLGSIGSASRRRTVLERYDKRYFVFDCAQRGHGFYLNLSSIEESVLKLLALDLLKPVRAGQDVELSANAEALLAAAQCQLISFQ